ncbi:XAC2610-related protein [Olleya sp. Bg11-27]|uniref:XAC2610-related protein n=1 Tax=Olleya sp. Bg11-27 TaxID=2058135 RepID=UPI000C31B20F|nr:hypothetical protein [Olleya sp. Bg11-27]AUC76190.1 hypothetical protein CW732_11150 [Olleya sp. Bg11-27]
MNSKYPLLLLLIIICNLLSCNDKTQKETIVIQTNKPAEHFLSAVSDYDRLLYKLHYTTDTIVGHAIMYNDFWSKIDSFIIKKTKSKTKEKLYLYPYNQEQVFAELKQSASGPILHYNSVLDNTPSVSELEKISEKKYNYQLEFIYKNDADFKLRFGTDKATIDTIINHHLFNLKLTDWNTDVTSNHGRGFGTNNLTIQITDTITKQVIQTITTNRVHTNKNLGFFSASSDFNFDGLNDLSIYTGNNASYGSPAQDVYLFDKEKNKFILNRALEKATHGTGYDIDYKRKMYFSYDKSGCCWHIQEAYAYINDTLTLIKSTSIEDSGYNDMLKVEEKRLINDSLITTVTEYHVKSNEEISRVYKKIHKSFTSDLPTIN